MVLSFEPTTPPKFINVKHSSPSIPILNSSKFLTHTEDLQINKKPQKSLHSVEAAQAAQNAYANHIKFKAAVAAAERNGKNIPTPFVSSRQSVPAKIDEGDTPANCKNVGIANVGNKNQSTSRPLKLRRSSAHVSRLFSESFSSNLNTQKTNSNFNTISENFLNSKNSPGNASAFRDTQTHNRYTYNHSQSQIINSISRSKVLHPGKSVDRSFRQSQGIRRFPVGQSKLQNPSQLEHQNKNQHLTSIYHHNSSFGDTSLHWTQETPRNSKNFLSGNSKNYYTPTALNMQRSQLDKKMEIKKDGMPSSSGIPTKNNKPYQPPKNSLDKDEIKKINNALESLLNKHPERRINKEITRDSSGVEFYKLPLNHRSLESDETLTDNTNEDGTSSFSSQSSAEENDDISEFYNETQDNDRSDSRLTNDSYLNTDAETLSQLDESTNLEGIDDDQDLDLDDTMTKNFVDPKNPLYKKMTKVTPLIASNFPKYNEPVIRFLKPNEILTEELPEEVLNLLKWQCSNITPKVLRSILKRTKFTIFKSTKFWLGLYGKHMKSAAFEKFNGSQKVNHFPGTFEIGRKDRLYRNVSRLNSKRKSLKNRRSVISGKINVNSSSSNSKSVSTFNPQTSFFTNLSTTNPFATPGAPNEPNEPETFVIKNYDFLPTTYVLPKDRLQLIREWSEGSKFIIKPCASARGIGIKVLNKFSSLPSVFKNEKTASTTKRKLLVQKYLGNPLLINGHKFDLRLYVLVTAFDPLSIYLYDNGLVRFATHPYSKSNFKNRYAHLTNYSINKNSSVFEKNDNPFECEGHKWTLKALFQKLKLEHGETKIDLLWRKITDIIVKTFMSIEAHVNTLVLRSCSGQGSSSSGARSGNSGICFEVFGVDVMIDNEFKPWLIEVNISPSLNQNSILDKHVKEGMLCDSLNLVGFRIPFNRLGKNQPSASSQNVNDTDTATCLKNVVPKLSISAVSNLSSTTAITQISSFTSTFYKNTNKNMQKIKNLNKAKRTKFVSNWLTYSIFQKLKILEKLSLEDKIIIRNYEDEYSRKGDFYQIFPPEKSRNLFAYDDLFERPRYGNCLIQAWLYKLSGLSRKGVTELIGSLQ